MNKVADRYHWFMWFTVIAWKGNTRIVFYAAAFVSCTHCVNDPRWCSNAWTHWRRRNNPRKELHTSHNHTYKRGNAKYHILYTDGKARKSPVMSHAQNPANVPTWQTRQPHRIDQTGHKNLRNRRFGMIRHSFLDSALLWAECFVCRLWLWIVAPRPPATGISSNFHRIHIVPVPNHCSASEDMTFSTLPLERPLRTTPFWLGMIGEIDRN